MAEDQSIAAPAIIPAASPAVTPAAPVAEAAVSSVAPVSTVDSAPAETISSPTPEATAEPAKPVLDTLLSAEPAKPAEAPKDTPKDSADVKPADKDAAPGEQKEESSQSDEPAPLPSYEAFVLPEGVALDTERLGEFTKTLAAFEASKPTHEEFQKFGQALVDSHVVEMQTALTRQAEAYSKQWEKQTNDWRTSFETDVEMGGNRKDTTLATVLDGIRDYGGKAEHQQDFKKLMSETGIGNHPAQIRLILNLVNTINGLKNKYETESATPLAAQVPAQGNKSKSHILYRT